MKLADPLRACSVEEGRLGVPWDQTEEWNSVSAFQELVWKQEGGRPALMPLCRVPPKPGLAQKEGPGAAAQAADGRPLHGTLQGNSDARGRQVPHTQACEAKRPVPPGRQKDPQTPSVYKKDKNIHCY